MFNIKNIVNRITDRGRESNPDSPGRAPHEDDGLSIQRAEGFLCPKCMKAFASPSELHSHYETLHAEESAPEAHGTSAAGFYLIHQEVGERYRHAQDGSSSTAAPGHSVCLEEVNSISDISELKKMLFEVMESKVNLQNEKDHLEQRAAQLAQLNVTLRAACDEGESSQAALRERLKVVEAQLAHRESIDDAAVLRQELVQVQRVMDELNREREHERDALRAELQQLQSSRSEGVTSELQEELVKKDTEIAKLKMSLDSTEESEKKDIEIAKLRICLDAAEKECLEMAEKLKDYDATEIKNENNELEAMREQLTNAMEESEKMIDSFKQEIKNISKERDILKESLHSIQMKSDDCKVSYSQELEELRLRLETATCLSEERNTKLFETQSEVNAVRLERDDLKTELLNKNQLIHELEQNKILCEEKILELTCSAKRSNEICSQLERERLELAEKIEGGEGAKTVIQQLTQENSALQVELREQMEKSSKNKDESARAIVNVTKKLAESEKVKQKIELQLQSDQSHLASLESKLVCMMEDNKVLQDQLSTKDVAMEELKVKIHSLEESLTISDKRALELEQTMSSNEMEMLVLKKKFEGIHSQLKDSEKEVKKLQAINSQLKDDFEKISITIQKLNTELTRGQETNRNLDQSVEALQEIIKMVEEERSKLREGNIKLKEDILEIKDKLKSTENQMQVQIASLETNLFEVQKNMAELENEKKDMEEEKLKETSALRELVKAKEELLEKREEALNILMGERLALTQQMEAIQKSHDAEIEAAIVKYQQAQENLDSCTKCREDLEQKLNLEVEKNIHLEAEIEKLSISIETQAKESAEKEKALQASLDEVSGEKLALDVKFETSQAERQALLERCFATASETETLHRTIADLRRKLDESQAALHELGRENQTLQLDIDKLVGRKWAEDSEVNKCTLCNKDFNLIWRKHHCRNCGQIFCNECSSKMAPVASNKKPVRVCDSCYGELTPK